MLNIESNGNDSLKEIHTTFDSDGSIRQPENKSSLAPKILSVIAAIILWLYVFQAVEYEKTFTDVTIEIRDNFVSESGLSIVNNYERTVDVTLSGTKNKIDNISVDQIKAYVNLVDVSVPDTYTRKIEIEAPQSVNIVGQSIEDIKIDVDRTVDKEITKIAIDDIYTIQSPLEIGEISILDSFKNPVESFVLTGPETDVSLVSNAVIQFDLGNITNNVSSGVRSAQSVKLYDEFGTEIDSKYIKIKPEVIRIDIPVYKTKQVNVIPKIVIDGETYKYSVKPRRVDIFGTVNAVDRIDTIETKEILIQSSGSYIVDLAEYEGVAVYKTGVPRTEENLLSGIAVDVTEITKPQPVDATLTENTNEKEQQ